MSRLLRCVALVLFVALGGAALDSRQEQAVDETTALAALGRAWGLAKYFHPDVAGGGVDWDAALLAAIPRVKAATTRAALNDEILRLVRAAGSTPRTTAGAPLNRLESETAFAWIDDPQLFDATTIAALKTIRHAQVAQTNRYVKSTVNVGNPDFSGEAAYDTPAYPAEAMRLLSLFRFWNMVQYFNPNRDITDVPWAEVLPAFIPRFIAAADVVSYHLLVCELASSINDTHGVVGSAVLSAHWGLNAPALRTRFVESETVVTRVIDRYAGGADVRPGDVITDVNGVPAGEVRARLRWYVNASNEGSLERNVDSLILRTNASTTTLGVLRSGLRRSVIMNTVPLPAISNEELALDSPLPRWRMLPGNIGYVHMGRLLTADVAAMIAELRNTRAIVFDVRNYPNGTLYVIAQSLNPQRRDFVKFTYPRYDLPGTILWTQPLQAGPTAPSSGYYRGRVILLGDERTQSHAEFTMMALRTAPDVLVVGSPTSGADGNVSLIALPGGLRTYFSGLGVFYPDGSPTQRVGIVPDVVATPTIQGIQNGADEVLDRALQLIDTRLPQQAAEKRSLKSEVTSER